MKNQISYQVMAQPAAQDVTVTFADGVSFTARYCGSGIERRSDGGEPFSHIQLSMIVPLDATMNPFVRCNASRTRTVDGASIYSNWPCVLEHGHTDPEHTDRDGDTW